MNRHVWISIVTMVLLTLQTPTGRASAALDAVQGTWVRVRDMPSPIMSHQAVLLRDGRVMVLGGEPILGVPVPWVQIYDPSTRAWSVASSMHVPRIGFTASVLLDGRVLVVGGIDSNMNDLASAEFWTPKTNIWSLLPNLAQTRFSQAASSLPDGRVLLVGGIVGGKISRSTLLFDPARNEFVPGPLTHSLHAQECAVPISGGRVLIAGGYGGNPEVYDPRTNTWAETGATPQRIRPVMASLPNGTVLLAGGTGQGGQDLRTVSVFHPAKNRWSDTGPLHDPRNSESGALLPNGQLLIAGGEQVSDHLLKSTELYVPQTRIWSMATPLRVARSGATSTVLLNGRVLLCGGGGFTGPLSSCEYFHR